MRICAKCEKISIGKFFICNCEFGTYNAIWACGLINAIMRLFTQRIF